MSLEIIYRKSGIRQANHFSNPPLTNVSDLKIPKDSIIHILPYNGGEYGPVPVEALTYELVKRKSNIFIKHIEFIKEVIGEPRNIHLNIRRIISDYHKKNRLFRLLRKEQLVLTNANSSLIINYCILPHLFRFTKSVLANYYQQKNIFNSLNENIEYLSRISNRPQYVEVQLPDAIKTLDEYQRILKTSVRINANDFNEGDLWTLFIINYLNDEVSEDFNLINNNDNIVFYWNIDNRVVFLSMKMLNDFKQKNNREAQKHFLNLTKALLEEQSKAINEVETDIVAEQNIDEPLDSEIKRIVGKMNNNGFISDKEKERFIKLANSFKEIQNPLGEGSIEKLLGEPSKIDKEIKDTEIINLPTMADKSMTKSTLVDFDKKYIEGIYQKDIANMIFNFQRAGIAVTNYSIEEKNDAATNAFLYKVQFTPIDGSPSTVQFKLPKINSDGTFLANNVKCRMDKQRADMPIRKIKPNRVALTSYYGKLFIDRDSRSVNDYGRWITNKLIAMFESPESLIEKMTISDVFDSDIKVPRVYSAIASRIEDFTYKNKYFSFNYKTRNKLTGRYKIEEIERNNKILCGKIGNDPVSVDFNETFYLHTNKGIVVLGGINKIFDYSLGSGPREIATMFNMGKTISVGIILGYRYGLTNLLKKLKVKYKIEKNNNFNLSENDFVIKFSDSILIIKDATSEISLILSGFNMYKKDIKKYKYGDFDHKDVYFNIFDAQGMTIRYLKEIDLIFQMFIDPITLELLKQIKEPTSIDGLLLRAVELLTTDNHPRETDMAYMRIRGYERLSGMVYNELIKSLRGYINSPYGKQRKIELNPRVVWLNVVKDDPSLTQVNETNPVQNLKEKEKVSYSGKVGGRDTRTMVRRTREFHPNDQGVISESTTDNGKVGVIAYLSADPTLEDIRGVTKRLDSDDGTSRQVSTTFLLSPCADRDEGKRVNFAGIQYTHTVAIEGNQIQPIRTGYESVIAHRSDSNYASVTKFDGVVTKVTENSLTVKYKNNSEESFFLGKKIAKTPGMSIIHEIITDREVGYKFKANEVICFNKGFFKRDLFNPKQVSFLMGAMSTVALLESTDTLEDSCAISERLSEAMSTKRTQVRNILVNFDQSIHSLVKVGELVETDNVLCIIEDAATSGGGGFDEESLQSLELLAANAPKAKYKGIIEAISILYYGDINNMSDSLAKLAREYDLKKKKLIEELQTDQVKNNKLEDSILIEQTKLKPNTFVLQIYIGNKEPMGIGDKGVVCNQLKTIVGRVMAGTNETESKIPIDAIFGFQSIANRVVLSPQITGTTGGALKLIGKKASEIFFE